MRTLYFIREAFSDNNSPHLSLVYQISCLYRVLNWFLRPETSPSQNLMRVPRVLLCKPWAAQPSWGFQGRTWVGWWVTQSSTCVLRMWSYSTFSAALEKSVVEYLEQCLRSRVKMHWKRWKQLLIFVSSAKGGEGAVCRAGKNMSLLSSVTHQLKNEFSSKTFIFAASTNFPCSHPKLQFSGSHL